MRAVKSPAHGPVTTTRWRSPVNPGTLSGTTFTFNSGYGKLKYSSNAQAVISGNTMTGTFIDSQGTSGGFVAYKDETVLRSSTILYSPPIVEVKGNKAKVTAVQFTEVADPANPTGPQDGMKISYNLKLTGPASRTISSKSNKYTFDNLPSGKFKVVSFMTATQNGKKLFTVTKSPGANFTIK